MLQPQYIEVKMKTLTKTQSYWHAHVEAARLSKGSIVDYAKNHDLNIKKLYYWRSTYTQRNQSNHRKLTSPSFAKVTVSSHSCSPAAALKIIYNKAEMQFTPLPSADWLRDLLSDSGETL